MKIRNGFVTNSSSTSFCQFGKYFDSTAIDERINEVLAVMCKIYKKRTGEEISITAGDIVEGEVSGIYCLSELIDLMGLSSTEDYDGYWVGLDIGQIRDDETFGDFKKEAIERMKRAGFDASGMSLIVSEVSS